MVHMVHQITIAYGSPSSSVHKILNHSQWPGLDLALAGATCTLPGRHFRDRNLLAKPPSLTWSSNRYQKKQNILKKETWTAISCTSMYIYISCIYHVYIMYISCIYHVYIMYISVYQIRIHHWYIIDHTFINIPKNRFDIIMIYTIYTMYMGLSENSVPLHPLVLLIIIPFLNGYFIGGINPTFSDKPISMIIDH